MFASICYICVILQVRNQWGTNWGVDNEGSSTAQSKGYILLKYGVNACGLTAGSYYTNVYRIAAAPTVTAMPTTKPTPFRKYFSKLVLLVIC